MDITSILIIGFGVSMDAFAVALIKFMSKRPPNPICLDHRFDLRFLPRLHDLEWVPSG